MGGQKSCGAQWVDISPVTYIDKCLRALLLQARSVGPKLYLCSGHSDPKYHENAGFDECIVFLRADCLCSGRSTGVSIHSSCRRGAIRLPRTQIYGVYDENLVNYDVLYTVVIL